MKSELRNQIKLIIDNYEKKVSTVYEDFMGTIAIRLNDDTQVACLVEELESVLEMKRLWSEEAIDVEGYIKKIHAKDTCRNILMNIATFGSDNTLEKIMNTLLSKSVVVHTLYSVEGIVLDKNYTFFGWLNLVKQADIPDSLIDAYYKAKGVVYRLSRKGIHEGITSGMVYTRECKIVDFRPVEDVSGEEMYRIIKHMQILSLLIPLTTMAPCHLKSNYTFYDETALIGTDSGGSTALPDISLNSKRRIKLDTELIEELGSKIYGLDREFQNHIMTIMRRFNNACARDSEVDVLIELRIVVESLLGRDRGIEPISHIISQRGAWVFGENVNERMKLSKFLKEAYGLSSKAVHGVYKSKPKFRELINDYRKFCSDLIIHFIREGNVPSGEQWNEIVLGLKLEDKQERN